MLKKIDVKKENMTSCYFIGGDFLTVFNKYFDGVNEDIEVFIETPKGIMMSLLVNMDSKYDGIILNLYNDYVNGSSFLSTFDEYPECLRSDFDDNFMMWLFNNDCDSCKVI